MFLCIFTYWVIVVINDFLSLSIIIVQLNVDRINVFFLVAQPTLLCPFTQVVLFTSLFWYQLPVGLKIPKLPGCHTIQKYNKANELSSPMKVENKSKTARHSEFDLVECIQTYWWLP